MGATYQVLKGEPKNKQEAMILPPLSFPMAQQSSGPSDHAETNAITGSWGFHFHELVSSVSERTRTAGTCEILGQGSQGPHSARTG